MMTMSPEDSVGTRQRLTPAFSGAGAGAEDLAVHRPVDDKGRGHGIDAQAGHKGRGFPMPVRYPPDQPGSASAAPAQAVPLVTACALFGGLDERADADLRVTALREPAIRLPPWLPRPG